LHIQTAHGEGILYHGPGLSRVVGQW
jgi:hypothetical protein